MTSEELQDAIVDADTTTPDIHDFPYVGACLSPHKNNIEDGWGWLRIYAIEISMELTGSMMYRVALGDGEDYAGGYDVVAESTFNKLAREMLMEAIAKEGGADPTNPDEADFMPVSNYWDR